MSTELVKHAAQIVEAYVSNNEVSVREVPNLLQQVFGTLQSLGGEGASAAPEAAPVEEAPAAAPVKAAKAPPAAPAKPKPVMDPEKAIQDDAIHCLICGKPCKALKGHLTRTHKIDCDSYRADFGLEKSYPMVAPAYAARRRQLAIDSGLAEKLQKARKQSGTKKGKK